MLDLRSFAIRLLLVLLAAGSWWLADQLTPKDEKVAKLDNSPVDYYSKNLHRTVLTPEGRVKEALFTEQMTHYKDDGRTEMEKPVMTLYQQQGEPWVIHAESAISEAEGKNVLMRGKVLITRKDNKGEEMKIVTSNVTYQPDLNYAETAEHILMLTRDDATSAMGAKVHFEPALSVKLLADVRRKHETH
jgi:lipopolysaccharide export system protein LptC